MAEQDSLKTLEESLALLRRYQDEFELKLRDPVKRRAWELVQAGEELFWKKQRDAGIRKLEEAAGLDAEYAPKVEAYRKLKDRESRKGRVNLTAAVNRILFPRMRELGWRLRGEEDGPRWKEGSTLVRATAGGGEAAALLGRSKFGKQFGLNVGREAGNGKFEYLDLRTVGLPPEALGYLNQAEADAVLERVAEAFEGQIQAWCDEARPQR